MPRCRYSLVADKWYAGSNSLIVKHLSLKFSKTSASKETSDWTYESYLPKLYILKVLQTFLTWSISLSDIPSSYSLLQYFYQKA